jgi:hypothetical protein
VSAARLLAAEVAAAQAEHARADAKAGLLLTAAGIAASVLTAGGRPGPAAAAAAAAWALSGLLALAVVLPRIIRRGRGFAVCAVSTADSVLARLAEQAAHAGAPPTGADAAFLVALCRLAVAKYRLVQAAVAAAGLALVLTAGALA